MMRRSGKVLDECKSYGKAPGAHDPPPMILARRAARPQPRTALRQGTRQNQPFDLFTGRRSPITQVFDLPVLFFAAIHQFEQAIGAPHI